MIMLRHLGRTGNQIFQYTFARILAEKNNLAIEAYSESGEKCPYENGWIAPQFIEATAWAGNKNIGAEQIKIDDQYKPGRITNLQWPFQNFKDKYLYIKGFFQNYRFYDENKSLVLGMWKCEPYISGHENDVALHLRLDDYNITGGTPVISPQWYASLIGHSDIQGKKVYIVVDKIRKTWEKRYMLELKHLVGNLEIVTQTAKEDFNFIRSCGTIICSNSSFAWWAAYLSKANKIFTFAQWLRGAPLAQLAGAKGFTPIAGHYYTGNLEQ
jgi:hypothetical protein